MYAIDPATGIATLVKANIVPGHVEGAEFYINNSTGEEVMVVVYQNGTSGGADRIMAFNPNPNGSNPSWSPYAGYPVALSGSRTQADGISWNPDTAAFYIQNDNNVDYYTLDITTGNTMLAFSTSSAIDGEGITYASDGTNYIEDENLVGLGRTIFTVDTFTGNLTPAAQLGSTGDVEYIMGNLGTRNDAGDAPSSYGYAAHLLPVLSATPLSIYMGTIPPDSEDPFVNFSTGFSDDNTGDDEDGVLSGGANLDNQILNRGQTKTIDITTNGTGFLNAWIDFNRDGDFEDAGEQIATDVAPSGGSIAFNVSIPVGAELGTSYARFRYSSETGLASGNSEAIDGEVEDYAIVLAEDITCPSGEILVAYTSINHVYATAVIVDNSVGGQNNALGNNNGSTASFNSNSDQLVLEMGDLINSGDSVTVHGQDGDDFDIWVSSSATGPWTQVGANAQLDYTFTSPINWLYIQFERGDSSGTENLSYVDASQSVITTICRSDTDNDGIPDETDLDDDNDGILDTVEHPKTVLWVIDGTITTDQQNVVDKLTSLGYTVTIADDGDSQDANNYEVTYLHPSVNSGTAFTNIANIATTTNGVITSENALFDELFGTTGSVGNPPTNLINIINNTHPITSGLSLGNYDVGDAGYYVQNIVSGTHLGEHSDGTTNLVAWEVGEAMDTGVAPGRRVAVPHTSDNGGFNANGEDLLVNAILWAWALDTDGDGISDDLDLDSDNDGIPDNVEAQTTLGYTPPNNDSAATYATNVGVNSAYLGGITPTNTDGTDNPDYLDLDSDNEGHTDTTEAGIALAGVDIDNDGLDDNIDTELSGYADPGGTIDDPLDPTLQLLDSDNDAATGGDVDFRDAIDNRPDNDLDGIVDALDFDDDNDGILDTDEGCGNLVINPSFEQQDFTDATVFPGGFTDFYGTFIGATYNTNTLAGWTYTQNMDGWVGNQSPPWWPHTFAEAYDKSQYMDVMGNNNVTGGVNNILSQTINTVVGETYSFSFFWGEDIGHAAGTTVDLDVNVTDAGSNSLISQNLISTAEGPVGGFAGPRNWYYFEQTFVATTTQTTIAFNATPDGTANGVALDFISVINTGSCRDTDNDGIADAFDLDSDNDGIYDAVEVGHGQPHTNGTVNGPVGTDGVPDSVQNLPNEEIVNYTLSDSDSDGSIDAIELDSDDDGCNDVIEAGFTDGDLDGVLGSSPATYDGNGLVTSGTDGYTIPADTNSNITYDFQEAGTAPSISSQPANLTICPGCSGSFSVTASDADGYQWQIFNGTIWIDLTDSGIHSGTTTATLNITNATPSDNGNQYRVLVINSLYSCSIATSNTAILTVNVSTVITNRRITYRVKKN